MLGVIVLLSFTALIVFCISLPLEIALRLDLNDRVKFKMGVIWLFGLVKREIRRGDGAATAITAPRRGSGAYSDPARVFASVWRVKGLPGRLFHLLKSCLKGLRLKELVARLKVGLDSPADTGLLFAYLSPLVLMGLFPRCDIGIEPLFEGDAVVRGYLDAVVSVRPARLLLAVAGFVFSLPVIRAVAAALRERWRGRSRPKRLCPSAA